MIRLLQNHRITVVWLLLIAATLISFEVGIGTGNLRVIGATVIVVAFIKVRLVIFEFMELRHAPRFMRLAADLWMAVIGTVLVTLYLLTPITV